MAGTRPNTTPPHASFAGVHFRLDDFDAARQDEANKAYRAARDELLDAMPGPAQQRARSGRYGFPEALSGLEGLSHARERAVVASLASGEARSTPGITDDDADTEISLEHESLVLATLARLDRAGDFSNSLLARLQVHWAARWRRTVLALPKSALPGDLRFDELAHDLAPTSRRMHARSDLDPPRREIRVEPPPPPRASGGASGAGSHAAARIPFDTEAVCTPRGWRAVIGVACLVKLVTEAEIAAEIGSVRLMRCASPKCGAWFIVKSPGGGRPRIHCGPGCRVAALRARDQD